MNPKTMILLLCCYILPFSAVAKSLKVVVMYNSGLSGKTLKATIESSPAIEMKVGSIIYTLDLVYQQYNNAEGSSNDCLSVFNEIKLRDNVVALIGPSDSGCAKAINNEGKSPFPIIASSASATDILAEKNQNFVRFTASDNKRIENLLNYLSDKQLSNATAIDIYYEDEKYSSGLAHDLFKGLNNYQFNGMLLHKHKIAQGLAECNVYLETCTTIPTPSSDNIFILGRSGFIESVYNSFYRLGNASFTKANYFTVGSSILIKDTLPSGSVAIGEHELFELQYVNSLSQGVKQYKNIQQNLANKPYYKDTKINYMTYELMVSVLPILFQHVLEDKSLYSDHKSLIAYLRTNLIKHIHAIKFPSNVAPTRTFSFSNNNIVDPPAVPIYTIDKQYIAQNNKLSQKIIELTYQEQHASLFFPLTFKFNSDNFKQDSVTVRIEKEDGTEVKQEVKLTPIKGTSNKTGSFFYFDFNFDFYNVMKEETVLISFPNVDNSHTFQLTLFPFWPFVLQLFIWSLVASTVAIIFSIVTGKAQINANLATLKDIKSRWLDELVQHQYLTVDSCKAAKVMSDEKVRLKMKYFVKRYVEGIVVSFVIVITFGFYLHPQLDTFSWFDINLSDNSTGMVFGCVGGFLGLTILESLTKIIKSVKGLVH